MDFPVVLAGRQPARVLRLAAMLSRGRPMLFADGTGRSSIDIICLAEPDREYLPHCKAMQKCRKKTA